MSKRKIPILATGGALLSGYSLYEMWKKAPASNKPGYFMVNLTGYDYTPNTSISITKTLTPFIPMGVGIGMSMAASKFGLNKYVHLGPFKI